MRHMHCLCEQTHDGPLQRAWPQRVFRHTLSVQGLDARSDLLSGFMHGRWAAKLVCNSAANVVTLPPACGAAYSGAHAPESVQGMLAAMVQGDVLRFAGLVWAVLHGSPCT